LIVGETREFEKPKDPHYRDFPVGIPMGLWRYPHDGEQFGAVALAKIEIDRVEVGNGKTSGEYRVLDVYDGDVKRVISADFV
jgi:hypothetical protein